MLRATTACAFSTSQLPKVLRRWSVLCVFSSKRASRHKRRAIFHLSSPHMAPHPPSEPTFRPSGATNHWKNTDFATFSRTCIVFPLTLSLLWSSFLSSLLWLFPPLLFHLSILLEVWLLNFVRTSYNIVFLVALASSCERWPRRTQCLGMPGTGPVHPPAGIRSVLSCASTWRQICVDFVEATSD